MKILFLTRIFEEGEAATEYAKKIAEKAVREGDEAVIVSFDDGSYYSIDERVDVHRVEVHFDGENLYDWSMMMNNELKAKGRELFEEDEIDLIHTVDWTVVPGGVTLSKHLEVPLVLTFQSTENERGFEGDHAGLISELEWQGAFEADRVIATDEDTKNSLLFDLDVPEEKLEVISPFKNNWEGNIREIYHEVIKTRREVVK